MRKSIQILGLSVKMNVIPMLPNETVYSLVTRFAYLRAEYNARSVCHNWIGRFGLSINQQLPSGLERIAQLCDHNAEKLLQEHTLFPIYSMSVRKSEELMLAMLSNRANNIASLSNALHLGVQTAKTHRYCPVCLEHDIQKYGVAYWHLEHQFTGISACTHHSTKLWHIHNTNRQFALPPSNSVVQPQFADTLEIEFAYFVMEHNEYFKTIPNYHPDVYDKPLIHFANERGLTKGKYFKGRVIRDHAIKFSHKLFGTDILSDVDIFNLLHKPNHHCHPIKPLFLQFIFQQIESEKTKTTISSTPVIPDRKTVMEKVRNLLSQCEFSMREIAKRTKTSVGFVKKVAQLFKLPIQKRTQFIDEEVEAIALGLAMKGEPRHFIAEQLSISVGAVEKIIESKRYLSAWRHYKRMFKRRTEAREAILEVLNNDPSATRNKVKKCCSADYTWLYKHDPDWLYRVLPRPKNHTKK